MKRRLLILIILIFIVTIGICIHINNMDNSSDKESGLSFYYQTSNGNYTKSSDEKWLTGDYALNAQNTTCDGIKSSDSVLWNNEENAFLLVTDKSMRCDLYFDKKRKYTLLSGYDIADEDVVLTNILGTDGDFESIEAWKNNNPHVNEPSHASYISCEISSDIKRHGNSSCKIPGDPRYTEILVPSAHSYPMILNHKYYTMFNVYNSSDSNVSLDFYWTAWSDKGNWIRLQGVQNKYNAWQTFSLLTENLEIDGESKTLRLDNNNWYKNVDLYFDELILVDLTDSYGANIPSKEELDNTLIYFDGKVDMKTVMGLEGKFKVNEASDNLDIECNNNGKATIKDGVVTITGDSPSTTCYLKKVNP